jgi:hypothetical protein
MPGKPGLGQGEEEARWPKTRLQQQQRQQRSRQPFRGQKRLHVLLNPAAIGA